LIIRKNGAIIFVIKSKIDKKPLEAILDCNFQARKMKFVFLKVKQVSKNNGAIRFVRKLKTVKTVGRQLGILQFLSYLEICLFK